MKPNDLVGETYGRLTVQRVYGRDARKNILWYCACICGGRAIAYAYDLRAGKVKSCGCLSREGMHTTHGFARAGAARSPIYSIWATMIQRCTNPKDRAYKNYGARGITVCKRWEKFERFLADMGEPPVGHSLDRKNNEKGYSKSNCRWATAQMQSRNKRSNVYVWVGRTQYALADACEVLGVTRQCIYYRMKAHQLTHQEAIDYGN